MELVSKLGTPEKQRCFANRSILLQWNARPEVLKVVTKKIFKHDAV